MGLCEWNTTFKKFYFLKYDHISWGSWAVFICLWKVYQGGIFLHYYDWCFQRHQSDFSVNVLVYGVSDCVGFLQDTSDFIVYHIKKDIDTFCFWVRISFNMIMVFAGPFQSKTYSTIQYINHCCQFGRRIQYIVIIW